MEIVSIVLKYQVIHDKNKEKRKERKIQIKNLVHYNIIIFYFGHFIYLFILLFFMVIFFLFSNFIKINIILLFTFIYFYLY